MGDDNLSKYKKVTFENCLGFLDINLRLFRANLIFPNNAFPLTFFTVFFFAILNFCYGRKDFCKRIFCLQFLLNKHIHIRFWKLGTSFTFCRSLIAISVLKNMIITYKIIPLPCFWLCLRKNCFDEFWHPILSWLSFGPVQFWSLCTYSHRWC